MKNKLVLLFLSLITMFVSAQSMQKNTKLSADVKYLETTYSAAKNPVALRDNASFMKKLRNVIARADNNSVYVINKYYVFVYSSGLMADVERALAKMPSEVKQSENGHKVIAGYYRLRNLGIGDKVPNFVLSTPQGKSVNLYTFLKGKKCVLLDFWASWCGWCRKESPFVKKVYEQYHGTDFDVISVSFDTDKNAWIKAIKDDGTDWAQVSDLKGTKGDVYAFYDLNGIPAIFLLDGEGHIIAKNLRGQGIENSVKRMLNK